MPGELIRYPHTTDGLSDALRALGTTPDAVATNLMAMGFTGKVNEPDCCPVANYLARSVERTSSAVIGKDENNGLYAWLGGVDIVDIDLPVIPQSVADFVLQFDARLFPDLIAEGTF
jgi:hypothetical protein